MKIWSADTSFLFSLFGKDGWTEYAREISQSLESPIHLSLFSGLELTNAALHAEFAGHLEAGLGNLVIARFESERDSGRVIHVPSNLSKIVSHAKELSHKHTLTGGHRTYDVLLVAAALEMKATDFLTFDLRQAKLAEAEGLRVAGVDA